MQIFISILTWSAFIAGGIYLLLFISLVSYRVYLRNSTKIGTPNGIRSLNEIKLGNMKQWIFIRGEEQKVISTGLYAIVRNPMYIGVLIMYIPTPIALGSYWGLIPFALLPVFLALRILNKEKVLSDNLKGYKEYCQRTRYRLIPYIW